MNCHNQNSPPRILCCPRLDRQGASSRYRTFQYLPYLRQNGFEIDVVPLFDEKYLQTRYASGRRSVIHVAPAFARRIISLVQSRQYDLIWTEKELLPWLPRWMEKLSLPSSIPYVVDYDDAEFHRYHNHRLGLIRFLLGKKIDDVMRRSTIVIAGNPYIADRARKAGAMRVELIPTVVDLDRYPPSPPPRNDVFTIGWIGTPITAKYLQAVGPALREVCRGCAARLVAVGSGPLDLPGVPVEVKPWSEETEVRDICQFDVGIMPLPDTLGTRGKCGLKLIQYMACNRPIVGTPIGVNVDIIRNGENGFQAADTAEWVRSLKELRRNATLRKAMGENGRKLVEERYSLNYASPRLAKLLHKAATEPNESVRQQYVSSTAALKKMRCDDPLATKNISDTVSLAVKPRLVHVTTVAGTQFRFLDGQNRHMIENGFDVHAVSSPGPVLEKLGERDSVETHGVSITRRITPFRDMVSLTRLFFLFRRLRPHIAHLSTPKGALLGALAAFAARVPIRIYHIRGLSSESEKGLKRTIFQWLERLTALLCNTSLSNAFSLLDYARDAKILQPTEGIVLLNGMSNGVDCRRFNPDEVIPALLSEPKPVAMPSQSAVVIGYVGRIVRDKGIEDLVSAWRQLRDEFPNAYLVLVGGFERECAIGSSTRQELASDPRIIVAGRQEDVAPFYRAMDIFAFPSHGTEGFPNVPMEASAMRLPVVATRVCGCVDAVVDGETGTLIPPRNVTALTEALRKYLSDAELRRRHGHAGRERVLEHFKQENIWKSLFTLYCDLLREHRLPVPEKKDAKESSSDLQAAPKRFAA